MSGGVPAGELLPCPFCGGDAQSHWHDGFPQITCSECRSGTGIFITCKEEDAITAWNTRATPTPPIEGRDADVERVAEAITSAIIDEGIWLSENLGRVAARAALQALGERG